MVFKGNPLNHSRQEVALPFLSRDWRFLPKLGPLQPLVARAFLFGIALVC